MIKAVIFDFGGVIRLNGEGNVLNRIAHAIGVPFAEFQQAYYRANHLTNVHNAKWEDVAVKVVREFDAAPSTESRIRKMIKEHETNNYINQELLMLFRKLRNAGLKVAILSNATSELRKKLEVEGISKLVDEIIISGEIGFQKPHREAFEVAFKKLGVAPSEVVFVDDSAKSLEKAKEVGYMPILFIGNAELEGQLRSLGIPV